MRRVCLTLLCFIAIGLGNVTVAAPVTLNAGDTAIFNFDFVAAGASPSPTYSSVFFSPRMGSDFEFGTDRARWTLFDELDGQGTNFFQGIETLIDVAFFNIAENLPIRDGIFSAVFEIIAGSITFDPVAEGRDSTGASTGPILPTAVTILRSVPEPATLVLLGIALAGLSFSRRKLS